jgi:hypothetical protein
MKSSEKFSIPSSVMSRRLGDELVILDLASGTYFGLDAIGARVWHFLETGDSLDALCSELIQEYQVQQEIIRADINRLIEQLSVAGLISNRENA